ncbi:SCP2 sterol-binding domain-containing protein [Amycolatopsis benzoatilytica]|uniref:SCP2 sterol-binding domain-containing protein n=1 Tax=Amycolatopsis benzoatilytica TaxID=346045 RepID=UPI00035CF30C|nr:SCP2 sterol-binding domain-containing protein [Amycolatopsis benzoatilytica]
MTEVNAERTRRAIVDHTRRLADSAVAAGADAAVAANRPLAIDADIASALITNHFAMLASPTWEMQRPESAQALRGTGQTLQWLATDTAEGTGTWFVERRPDGATWQPSTRQADVTITGPAGTLLLVLTRRRPLADRDAADITVEGDAGLAQHWLDNSAHSSD